MHTRCLIHPPEININISNCHFSWELLFFIIIIIFVFIYRGLDERDKTPGHDRVTKTRAGRRKQNDRPGGRGEDENDRKQNNGRRS